VIASQSVLRPWVPADGGWHVSQLADSEIQRFTTASAGTTVEQFQAALASMEMNDDQAGFAIVDPGTGELAGNIAASRHDGVAELSYWVAPAARGKGLATRALAEFSAWVVDRWVGVERVVLWTHADNVASQRTAEKAGFRYDESRDEIRTVGSERWPARWYVR
jgi:RimJ/RimL family protein N-acetyltransferase